VIFGEEQTNMEWCRCEQSGLMLNNEKPTLLPGNSPKESLTLLSPFLSHNSWFPTHTHIYFHKAGMIDPKA